jgi:hypothetical protein
MEVSSLPVALTWAFRDGWPGSAMLTSVVVAANTPIGKAITARATASTIAVICRPVNRGACMRPPLGTVPEL